MWFWALNGCAHLAPYHGILLNFGCSSPPMDTNTHWKGLQPGSLSIISSHRMEKLLKKSSHGVIAQLHSIQMQPSVAPTTPLDLQQILDHYIGVFVEPVGLPPSWPEDHRIQLLPDSIPPNIRPYLRKFILVFFDDILIYSKTWAEHLQHLALVMQLFSDHHLHAKNSKCVFGQKEVEYLKHIISTQGVHVDPTKITAMNNWSPPKTLKSLCGFLGLTGY